MVSGKGGSSGRPIVLLGFMAAGKTKIGRLLAERLDVPFVDSDTEIEAAFGQTVSEIFRHSGEAEFRTAERRTIARLVEGGPRVIAIGGGAFVDPETRATLNRLARTVWLDPTFEVIAARLARSTERPLASDRSEGELRQLWEERRPCYAAAQLRVEPSDDDPARSVDEIVRGLGS